MAEFPSLPLFTDAFIADTGHLTAEQTGAYLLLLMMAWRSPKCRLPDNDAKLARWARVDLRRWSRVKAAVMGFWILSDGYYTQKRLSREFTFVGAYVRKAKSLKNKEREKSSRVSDTKSARHYSKISPRKSLKNNKVESPPNPNPNPKRRKQDARAREEKNYGKEKPNGFRDALDQGWQSVARDKRRIAEAERRNQRGGADVVRLLPKRRRS
jgi:uncharacterized protein YdaU (DUF1376 family)